MSDAVFLYEVVAGLGKVQAVVRCPINGGQRLR